LQRNGNQPIGVSVDCACGELPSRTSKWTDLRI
jgi:hypothetical protein